MILDIDIGNSYAKWRLTDGAVVYQSGSQATQSISDGLELPSGVSISRVRLSSVASDSLQGDLVAQMKSQFNAEVTAAKVSSSTAGVICGYDDPSSLGIDRWLAMVASYSRYQASVLVVDAGSAMTLDLCQQRVAILAVIYCRVSHLCATRCGEVLIELRLMQMQPAVALIRRRTLQQQLIKAVYWPQLQSLKSCLSNIKAISW